MKAVEDSIYHKSTVSMSGFSLHGDYDCDYILRKTCDGKKYAEKTGCTWNHCHWKPQRNIQPSVQSDDDPWQKKKQQKTAGNCYGMSVCIQRKFPAVSVKGSV